MAANSDETPPTLAELAATTEQGMPGRFAAELELALRTLPWWAAWLDIHPALRRTRLRRAVAKRWGRGLLQDVAWRCRGLSQDVAWRRAGPPVGSERQGRDPMA
jgi:hypothetical protein